MLKNDFAAAGREYRRLLIALMVVLYAGWALFGLTSSPGFMIDESPIIDAAHTFQELGYLAVRTAGPGFHHYEDAYLSQMPLHPLVLGLWFKLWGFGLFQGRLLSVLLACVALWMVARSMADFSIAAILIAIVLLGCDPMFSERARLARYDWLAVVFGFLAWRTVALRRESEGPLTIPVAALVGMALGLATSAHLLYGFSFAVTACVVVLVDTKPRRAIVLDSVMAAACVATLIPSAIYMSRHHGAFEGQLIFQIKTMGAHSQTVGAWLHEQTAKYVVYFAKTPMWLVLGCFSIGLGAVSWRRATMAGDVRRARVLRNLLVSTAAMTVTVNLGSPSGTWYLLILAPFYAVLGGATIDLARPGFERKIGAVLVALALINGIGASLLGRTYSAMQMWGTRDASRLQPTVSSMIPAGSTVFGDRRLIFEASKGGWTLFTDHEILPGDTVALAKIRYDFLALSDDVRKSPWLPMADYQKFATAQPPPSPFRLPSVNEKANPMRIDFYRRRD